jgi:hypothetical protein
MQMTTGGEAMKSRVLEWHKLFKEGRENLEMRKEDAVQDVKGPMKMMK